MVYYLETNTMLHRHHASRHLLGFLSGVILVGSVLGGMSGRMGHVVFDQSNALGMKNVQSILSTERKERLKQSFMNRRERRNDRRQNTSRGTGDVGSVVPMQINTFSFKGKKSWDVALNTSTLVYDRLGIAAPIGKPSPGNWISRNWRALEDQMQYLLLNGLAAYPHSPKPGEAGSMIVAGHSSPPTMDALRSP